MTQEDKELLIKDMCSRLPYGVQILYDSDKKFNSGLICQPYGLTIYNGRTCALAFGIVDPIEIDEFKLCLRTLSSITGEEEKEFNQIFELELKALEDTTVGHSIESAASSTFMIDFYNKHHFDYRGLISMHLALEAPEGIYVKSK